LRACVIFNPTAKGDKAKRFRQHLDAFAHEAELRPTDRAGAGRSLAAQAVRDGFDVIVAAGGDGTLNEVLNGLGGEPDGFDRARLGVLPLGTANVFARQIRQPFPLRKAWETIRQGHERQVDLLRAEFRHEGRQESRWIVQLAGAGLDARAVELVDWRMKKRTGFLAYILAGFKGLAEKQPCIKVTTSERTLNGKLVLMGNGRLYGGPFEVFPGADLSDGLLDLRVFPRISAFILLRCALAFLVGRLGTAGGSIGLRTNAVELEAAERVPVEIDGELAGELPLKVSVSRNRLRVLAPSGTP